MTPCSLAPHCDHYRALSEVDPPQHEYRVDYTAPDGMRHWSLMLGADLADIASHWPVYVGEILEIRPLKSDGTPDDSCGLRAAKGMPPIGG